MNGFINGYPYKCNLIPRGKGNYLLLLTKLIQKAAGINPGDILNITMNLDTCKTEKDEDIAPSLGVTKPKMKMNSTFYFSFVP